MTYPAPQSFVSLLPPKTTASFFFSFPSRASSFLSSSSYFGLFPPAHLPERIISRSRSSALALALADACGGFVPRSRGKVIVVSGIHRWRWGASYRVFFWREPSWGWGGLGSAPSKVASVSLPYIHTSVGSFGSGPVNAPGAGIGSVIAAVDVAVVALSQ